MSKDAVILGGGISGLSLAYFLKSRGLNILLLEKASQTGGVIQTEQVDGFLIDYGPNSTLETSPVIGKLIEELGIVEERVYANKKANRRYVLKDGQLHPLPLNPFQFIHSRLFSFKAKMRLLVEPFIKAPSDEKEESIAEFVVRRLGEEFLNYAINPFIAGVYAGNPTRLSVRSAVPKIYALEKNYGSLIKGAIKGAKQRKKRKEIDKTRARLFSFLKGMATLPAALQRQLTDVIETSVEVKRLHKNSAGGFYEIEYTQRSETKKVLTSSVIFTTPAYITAQYVKSLDTSLADHLKKITYAPVAVVFMGFKKPVECRPLDGFGFLIPEVEKRHILGTIWSSTIFPERAPVSGIALTTFVGGMRQPELVERDDHELIQMVLSDLAQIMRLRGQPDLIKIKRWKRAIPQYELGHQQIIDAITEFEHTHPGLFIFGNFRGGISVGDCVVSARQNASLVVQYLKNKAFQGKKENEKRVNL